MKFKDIGSNEMSSKDLLKLQDKDSVTGIFRGEPYDFKQHWIAKQAHPCTGTGCAHCASGNKPTFRFRLNFIMKENGNLVAKIFEQGFMVYKQLKDLNSGDFPLEKTFVKITRSGSGTDTTYSILPTKHEVTPAVEKEIAAIQLHDLNPETVTATENKDFDDIPF